MPIDRPADLRSDLDVEAGVLTLTLNRPEARNALTLAMLTDLADALDDAEQAEAVRVVVLTGAGTSFSAGGDVKVFARGESIFGPMSDPDARTAEHTRAQRRTTVRLQQFPKPTIALLPGPAVGAGLALALACDLRYAAADAQLRAGFVAAGLAGDFGVTWLLNRLVGPARAAELLYLSRSLSAEAALHWGLLNGVFAPDQVAERGHQLAGRLAAQSMPALRAVKENIIRAQRADLPESADAEVLAHVRLMATPEHRATVAALVTSMSAASGQSEPSTQSTGDTPL